jgi:hypothetical protein
MREASRVAALGEGEPLEGDCGPAHVAHQPFELPGLPSFDAGAGVQ